MNTYKEVMKKVSLIQDAYKDIKEYKSLCTLKEPGTTSFIPNANDVAICPIELEPREGKLIQSKHPSNQPAMEDFMGVYPFQGIVMESGTEDYKPGQVVFFNESMMQQVKTIVVDCGILIICPRHIILGINSELTNKK